MKIIPWSQKENMMAFPFGRLHQEMDSLFANFFEDFSLASSKDGKHSFVPSIDIQETDKEIKVMAELPGMDEKDIEISLIDNMLTIRGEKKHEVEEKKNDFYHMERSYGAFHRSIPLSVEIKADKVEAKFKKGILYVNLPKSEEQHKKAKQIKIKT